VNGREVRRADHRFGPVARADLLLNASVDERVTSFVSRQKSARRHKHGRVWICGRPRATFIRSGHLPESSPSTLPGLFRIRGGIRSASHGITAKHGMSETSGTTVNVVEPI
jgi:hypothetical protein